MNTFRDIADYQYKLIEIVVFSGTTVDYVVEAAERIAYGGRVTHFEALTILLERAKQGTPLKIGEGV